MFAQAIVAAEPFAIAHGIPSQSDVASEPFAQHDAIVEPSDSLELLKVAELSVKTLKQNVHRRNLKIKRLQQELSVAKQQNCFGDSSKSQITQHASSGMLLALLRCTGHGASSQLITIARVMSSCRRRRRQKHQVLDRHSTHMKFIVEQQCCRAAASPTQIGS